MPRFFTRLFGACNTTACNTATKTTRCASLSVESLETRATPSGMHVSQILKHVGKAVHTSQALASKLNHSNLPHVTLAQALTLNGVTVTLHR